MFKNIASDLSGSADVCKVLNRAQLQGEPILSYLLPHEVGYFAFKSGKEIHIFTDLAYITITGANATTTRKYVDRHEYYESHITNVCFETAGMGISDRDVELKFNMDGRSVSIDIWKNEIETAKVYYKFLVELSHVQARNKIMYNLVTSTIGKMTMHLNNGGGSGMIAPPPGPPPGHVGMAPPVAGPDADAWINNICRYAEVAQGRFMPFSYRYLFEQYRL
ncbi:hypothetical protein HDV05_006163 [Chytridiales sp. JEL 0842]|nr:hypothetical protein HDV05_006163 [Chytridiales sp. JEL 0842]